PVVVCLDSDRHFCGGKSQDRLVFMVCSWQLVASWVFVHGGQRHSSIGGQLRVAASPVMVMAIPYPFAFVPFASSLFCF
ncbi:hypothetical protein CARUB_v10018722mg, partial [Capsella rubella]